MHSNQSFSQEVIILSENKVSVGGNSDEVGLLVLPAQNIYAELASGLDLVSTSPIQVNSSSIESESALVVSEKDLEKSEESTVKETKNRKTVSVKQENRIFSVIVANKNGTEIESILPVTVANGQNDQSEIFTVVSDRIFIADGTKLKVSSDQRIYWNQVFDFACSVFSVSSEKNILTVKLVNGAEFIFNTEKELTLLSFAPPVQNQRAPVQQLSTKLNIGFDLNFSIGKDLKQFSPVCKKKQQSEHFDTEKFKVEPNSDLIVFQRVNLWSPVTGTVYDSESFDFMFTLADQTYPNFTQSNYQTLNTSGNIFIPENQFC